jgi:hypothetical protein
MSQAADALAESSRVGGGGGRNDDIPFVPPDFRVPDGLADEELRLEPLGPEHNDRDYRAWTTSMEHIQSTPGFEQYGWPEPMTAEENLRDLVQHADDFRRRVGFTYSVIVDDSVVGCVYIYPSDRPGHAAVRSWVREDCAHLDEPLYRLVNGWLRRVWPFSGFNYSARDSASASP